MNRSQFHAMSSTLAAVMCSIQASCHPAAPPKAPPTAEVRAATTPEPTSAGPPLPADRLPTPEKAFEHVLFTKDVEIAEYGYWWHPEKLVPIKGGFALLMSWAEDSCHACQPTLGVAYFHPVDGHWRQYGLWENVYQDGWDGHFRNMEVIEVGQPDPTVAVHGGWFGEGCNVDAMGLVELTPEAPIMRIVRAPLGADNGGQTANPKYRIGYDAAISPLEGRPGLKIRYHGELARKRPVDATVVYSGSGQRWRPHPRIFKGDCANYWSDTE